MSERGLWPQHCILRLVMMSALGTLAARAESVIVRSELVPTAAYVGQRVVLRIDVLGRDGWTQISGFGGLEVPGAYVLGEDGQGIRLNETIDGSGYTGQRYELSIVAQRGGEIRVPAFDVEAVTRGIGPPASKTSQIVTVPAVTAMAHVPPGAEGLVGLVTTRRLSAEQEWEGRADPYVVGGAITRRIIVSADDVLGMAFVPLNVADQNGLRVYPGEPEVRDTRSRGSLKGTRIETVTYVFQAAGEFELPAIVYHWWHPTDKILHRATLDGLSVSVEPGPVVAGVNERVAEGSSRRWRMSFWWVLVVTGVGIVARYRGAFGRACGDYRAARRCSEAATFQRALVAIQANEGTEAYNAVMTWAETGWNEPGPARMDRLGDAESVARLTRLIGAPLSTVEMSEALESLRELRRGVRRRAESDRARQVLPELNGPSNS